MQWREELKTYWKKFFNSLWKFKVDDDCFIVIGFPDSWFNEDVLTPEIDGFGNDGCLNVGSGGGGGGGGGFGADSDDGAGTIEFFKISMAEFILLLFINPLHWWWWFISRE